MDEREDWWMTDAEVDYFLLVENDRVTCGACPYQVEGKLKDGRLFYFRYRWGGASLGVSATDPVGAQFHDTGDPTALSSYMDVSDGLDGYMDNTEYRSVFVKLYRQLEAR